MGTPGNSWQMACEGVEGEATCLWVYSLGDNITLVTRASCFLEVKHTVGHWDLVTQYGTWWHNTVTVDNEGDTDHAQCHPVTPKDQHFPERWQFPGMRGDNTQKWRPLPNIHGDPGRWRIIYHYLMVSGFFYVSCVTSGLYPDIYY